MLLLHLSSKEFFSYKNKQAAQLVDDLEEALRDMIKESDWIDEAAKKKALKKIDNMITLLGFPDFANDPQLLDEYYENMRICKWDHFGNSQRIRAMNQALQFSQLGKPRNREM